MALVALLTLSTSCVHEWPGLPETRKGRILVKHELPWRLFEWNYSTRADAPAGPMAVRYIYEIYPAGTTERAVARYTQIRTDISLADFYAELDLPVGEYDVYVWSDFIYQNSEQSLFYDAQDLSDIKVKSTYKGNTENKDAFQGRFRINVPSTIDQEVPHDYEVLLTRPLTAYAFLSTDLSEFIEQEVRRTGAPALDPSKIDPSDIASWAPAIDFDHYTARFYYTGYLPVEYSIFRDRPIDSATGVIYEGKMDIVNSDEVLIGFDYFFINGRESSINVAIEIFDPKGEMVAAVPTVTVPVERGRATIVRGEFLTSKAHGGVGINPDFFGEFNVEIP